MLISDYDLRTPYTKQLVEGERKGMRFSLARGMPQNLGEMQKLS